MRSASPASRRCAPHPPAAGDRQLRRRWPRVGHRRLQVRPAEHEIPVVTASFAPTRSKPDPAQYTQAFLDVSRLSEQAVRGRRRQRGRRRRRRASGLSVLHPGRRAELRGPEPDLHRHDRQRRTAPSALGNVGAVERRSLRPRRRDHLHRPRRPARTPAAAAPRWPRRWSRARPPCCSRSSPSSECRDGRESCCMDGRT